MLTTPELIIALERRGVLPQGDVVRVRQLYENSPTEFAPRVMLKWLVSRRRLTLDEADRLLTIDPALTATEALDLVLGRNDHLELAHDDQADATHEDDTKDMLPLDEKDDVKLPPKGTAPFADSPDRRKQALIAPKRPPSPPPPKEKKPAAATEYGELFDEILSGSGPSLGALPSLPPPKLPPAKRRWDTPLLLGAGGALTVVVLVGAFLLWRVVRQGGDDAFAAAEESYRSASYSTAVERYDKFLADYPTHRSAGLAVVHRGLARLRAVVEAGGDPLQALAVAKSTLDEISPQAEFSAAKADLAALLPDIADRLARQAVQYNDAAALEGAREARKLIDRSISSVDAIASRLREIDGLTATAERRAARAGALQSAVAAIKAAAVARDLDKAEVARRKLLGQFVDAANEPMLLDALRSLSEAKRQAVRFVADEQPAETTDPPSAVVRVVTLADRTGGELPQASAVCFAAVEGTLFTLAAADGRLVRRRTIGFDAGPLAFFDVDGARDVLLDEGPGRGLVRLSGNDGALRWRQPAVRGEIAIERDRLFAAGPDGVAVVEAATGRRLGSIRFPRRPVAASTGDDRERVRYQLGEADDLYVLAAADYHCLQAYFVGHASESVAVGPTCVGQYVLLVENVGDDSRVRLLEAAADGTIAKELGTRTLRGRVSRPPQVSQRLVAVVTHAGAAYLFDLSGAKDRNPLEPVAQLAAAGSTNLVRHFLFQDSTLWLGGNDLTKYEYQPTLGKLTPAFTALQQRASLQPPQLLPGAVAYVGQPSSFAGPRSVAAIDAVTGKPIWETGLALRLHGAPLVSPDGTVTSVTEAGAVYDVSDDAVQVLDEPTVAFGDDLAPRKEFSASTSSTAGNREETATTRPADGAAVYVLADAKPARTEAHAAESLLVLEKPGTTPRTIVSPPVGAIASPPTPYRDGVLVPTADGQVRFLDPRNGLKKAESFQPPLVAGAKVAWSQAAVVGDDVLIADAARLYRLGVDDQTTPQLRQRSVVELPQGASYLAAVGNTVYLAESGLNLQAYSLADLKPGQSWKIVQLRDWGPTAVGDRVLAAAPAATAPSPSHQFDLLALSGEGSLVWRVPLERPCHRPVGDGDDVYLAEAEGIVIRLDAASGEERGRVKLDVPIAAPPAVAGDRLILTTEAGELVWIAKP